MIQTTLVRDVADAIRYFEALPVEKKTGWAVRDECCYAVVMELNDMLRRARGKANHSEIPAIDGALKQIWRRDFLEYIGERLGLL